MKKFAIIQAGLVANIALSHEALDATWIDITNANPQPGPGWLYDGTTFTAPAAVVPVYHLITAEAFWDRFTDPERLAYEVAMQDVPTDTAANRNAQGRLRIFQRDINTSGRVDLTKPKVVNKMNGLLVTQNILTAARATTILTTPITADEAA